MTGHSIEITTAVPQQTHVWPWAALGAILLVLLVIARLSRRRPPFGL